MIYTEKGYKMNLPNRLTILRIIMIPIFVAIYYIMAIPYNFIIAGVIFALASFTDFLDGYIARKNNLVTDFGKFLDPIADKVLVSTALIVLLLPLEVNILPWYASIGVAVILARELIISGFRLVAAGKGIVIAADKSGKLKTFFTDVAILVLLVAGEVQVNAITIVGQVMFWIAVLLTIISGAECIIKNRKVLSENK